MYTFVKLIISNGNYIVINHGKVIIRLLIGNSKNQKRVFVVQADFDHV